MSPKKRGIRQRLGLDGGPPPLCDRDSSEERPPVHAESSSQGPRRGIRRRLGIDQPASSTSAPAVPTSSSDRGRGGIRRRLGVDQPASSSQPPSSSTSQPANLPLNKTLKKKFADGRLSAVEVEELFRGAAVQGARGTPELSSPNHPQNLQRSLVAAWGIPKGAPDIDWRMIPTSIGIIPHPFLLPHKFFASLHSSVGPSFWSKSVSGPIGAATRFWANMAPTAFVQMHPHLEGVDKSKLVPLGMHGDSGKFSHQENLFVFTFNSCLGEGTTGSTRFLMTSIKKSMIAPQTIDAIAKVLGWSFNVLLTGIEPTVDENGDPLPVGAPRYLAGGWKGVLTKVRGDWEFYSSVFKVPNWKAVGRMCWMCAAVGLNSSALRYSRTDAGAPWRGTRQTHEEFLRWAIANDLPISSFFQYIKGLRIDCIMIDVLHCVDLGIFAHCGANILWEVVSLNLWGTTQEQNVKALEKMMKQYEKDQGVTNRWRGKLTVDRVKTSGGWPKLKTQAAVVRGLAPFCLHLSQTYLTVKHAWLCQMMVRFYELLDSEPLFLSAEARDELKQLGLRFSDLYNEFAAEAFVARIRMWKGSPKLHMFQHLCEWQGPEMGNPRYFWCYADEDMVGKMIKTAQSCHPKTLCLMTLWKWLLGYFEQELK